MPVNNASNPYPPAGDTNGASPDVVLRWKAGDNAAVTDGHHVYFGTDPTAVVNGHASVDVGLQTGTTYAPPALTAGTTYYWRVDEVSSSVPPSVWTGPVWSFTVFDGAGQPAGYRNGYATWCVSTMATVNLTDRLPGGSPDPPTASVKLARCESAGFQVAIQPASGRRLDHVRLVISDLTSGENTLSAGDISWQVVGVIRDPGGDYPDILLPVSSFDAAAGNTHSMLVTLLAPAGTPSGLYTGTITVKTDSGLDTTVNVHATVYGFAIPAASTVGSMHLRTTWTLADFGTAAEYQDYGDFLLGYRMCPDNIYRNGTPSIATLEHWYGLGLNTFSVFKADQLANPQYLQSVHQFFTDLAASPLASQLRGMAQFYGYDEADLGRYGKDRQDGGMRALYGTIKAAYPDIPTTTTCQMYYPPWEDPVKDMTDYHCDWICAGALERLYSYADGELLRSTVIPGNADHQKFQYWAYNAAYAVNHPESRLYARTTFWLLFQQRADGFLYYRVNGWWDANNPLPDPIDPTRGPILQYTYPSGHTAGVLMYRGKSSPLASMRMVNIRDGMQDWEYLWAIGHYDTDGVTRLGKIASVETARELAEQIAVNWITDTDPAHILGGRDVIAAWLGQPYVARYPTPEHRSRGVSATPTLTWQADSVDVSSFDVYFGTDRIAVRNATRSSPEFKTNQTATAFKPSGRLAMNTNYYWRIDEVVGAQAYKGYVWSLTCSHGLVGWWKFDEPAGTTALDSSGLGHDATITRASRVPGVLKTCLEFTGTGSVGIPPGVLSTVDRQISIAFWLYGAESQPQAGVVFEALTTGGATVLRGRVPSSDRVAYFEAGVSNVVSRPMTLTQSRSRWQHWAFTKNADTGQMKIYLNGVLWANAAGNTQGMAPALSFTIGSKCDGTLGYEGKIDEVRVYDGELPPEDITALYQVGAQRSDRGLMGWWRFDELSGTTVKDWSDLQNHGSLGNPDQVRQAGQIGNSLTFNGTSDRLDIPVNGMTFPGMAITFSVWTHGDASLPRAAAYGSVVVSAFKTDGTVALMAAIPDGDGSMTFRAGSSDGADTKSTRVFQPSQYKGQWNHWVITRDDSGFVRFYLNGGLVWADPNWGHRGLDTLATFRIGKGTPGKVDASAAYKGMLDEIRLYNYALSAADVADLYSADSTRFSGQIGRWTFDENAGAMTADATPFGNHGTITNAVWSNGRIGSALQFHGAGSHVSIPATALASLDKQVTITLWLYGAASPPRDSWVFEALDAAGGPTIRAAVPGIAGAVVFDAGFGGAAQFDAARTTAVGFEGSNYRGQWNHWAFTKNAVSGVMNIYLNGLLWHSATGKYRPLTPATTFRIGSNAGGSSGYAGVIDDVRIYNLELDPSDIYNIYLDCPPLPNPMTWSTPPQAAGPTSITMAATVALHPNGVEYYFQCTAGGGHDSGWQASPSYTDTGLAEQTQYTYVVMAREKGPDHHQTGLSSALSASTLEARLPSS